MREVARSRVKGKSLALKQKAHILLLEQDYLLLSLHEAITNNNNKEKVQHIDRLTQIQRDLDLIAMSEQILNQHFPDLGNAN